MKIKELTAHKDLIEYEKALYDAFSKKDKKGWIFTNYKKVNNNRLIPIIPYSYLQVFVIKNEKDLIIAGGAINYNKEFLQCEKMGFKISKKSEKYCEGINFFISPYLKGLSILSVANFFFDYTYYIVFEKGIRFCYGTCTSKLLKMYNRVGWKEIDSKIVNNVKKYLIKK